MGSGPRLVIASLGLAWSSDFLAVLDCHVAGIWMVDDMLECRCLLWIEREMTRNTVLYCGSKFESKFAPCLDLV